MLKNKILRYIYQINKIAIFTKLLFLKNNIVSKEYCLQNLSQKNFEFYENLIKSFYVEMLNKANECS